MITPEMREKIGNIARQAGFYQDSIAEVARAMRQMARDLNMSAATLEALSTSTRSANRNVERALEIAVEKAQNLKLPIDPYRLKVILNAVSTKLSVPVDLMFSRDRTGKVAFARQVAMYLCRKLTGGSFPEIGQVFLRDHSSVIHACNLIAKRIDKDGLFAKQIVEIEDHIVAIPKQLQGREMDALKSHSGACQYCSLMLDSAAARLCAIDGCPARGRAA